MVSDLAYMNRWEWSRGFRMAENSTAVHQWLDGREHVLVVPDVSQIAEHSSADGEAADFISPRATRVDVVDYGQLSRVAHPAGSIESPVIFVHPSDAGERDVVRRLIEGGHTPTAFVMVWSELDRVRLWMEARRASNLLGGPMPALPDALAMKAAEAIVREEYNGLTSGRGKDAVIQSVHALHAEGYPLDAAYWARAILAAGGTFRSADTVATFVTEMVRGVRHRVTPRFRPEIASIWREMLAKDQPGAP